MGSALRALAIVSGALMLLARPSPQWIESAYVNGGYPVWQHAMYRVTSPLPWSLGDVAVALLLALAFWGVAAPLRKRRTAPVTRFARALVNLLAVAGFAATWFYLSWGWNYDRAPVETRLAFDPSRITPAASDRLRSKAIAMMNRLAAPAHERSHETLDAQRLSSFWLPAVQRGGDEWSPLVTPAKPTVFDPFMSATGTTGFINPLTLNVHLATDLLWFERPFTQAHEWSHDAAYAREDEANYFGILTCLRSTDPVMEYSGWFELFLYLPPLAHYDRKTFVPPVWSDFAALRDRNKRRINLSLQTWTWRTYGNYLKSNHIASGTQNYDEVTRLMLGIPLDASGLPERR